MVYFPMMVPMAGKRCIIVGGGKVAARKVRVMRDFHADVVVIAPYICDEIRSLPEVTLIERPYSSGDLAQADMVIAATDDPACNHEIAEICKQKRIPVNAVDQAEDCSFIFPSYWKQKDVVAAFSSGGSSPVITQYLKEKTRETIPEYIGDMADCLGAIRERVKQTVSPESRRKACYKEIFLLALEQEAVPSEEKIESILHRYETEEK